ncbi:hypothetical protein M409DRAFT_30275 [Zasmidium cellare ATCC 36951]|uniref:Uncharacterized protein n=1 Tax=Zasmidium cellare ATCC 36951 TaxID=1080233 RepID=A0A6A6BZD1_ZASCE|nr:uncharacterized protein M409DRAFT_30275 [Zasmidium cellare ATCC 36951]KAF2159270.1 hypothetical protein M409DRAFT_30275 [Zasmidium cellare ATCC 36951]
MAAPPGHHPGQGVGLLAGLTTVLLGVSAFWFGKTTPSRAQEAANLSAPLAPSPAAPSSSSLPTDRCGIFPPLTPAECPAPSPPSETPFSPALDHTTTSTTAVPAWSDLKLLGYQLVFALWDALLAQLEALFCSAPFRRSLGLTRGSTAFKVATVFSRSLVYIIGNQHGSQGGYLLAYYLLELVLTYLYTSAFGKDEDETDRDKLRRTAHLLGCREQDFQDTMAAKDDQLASRDWQIALDNFEIAQLKAQLKQTRHELKLERSGVNISEKVQAKKEELKVLEAKAHFADQSRQKALDERRTTEASRRQIHQQLAQSKDEDKKIRQGLSMVKFHVRTAKDEIQRSNNKLRELREEELSFEESKKKIAGLEESIAGVQAEKDARENQLQTTQHELEQARTEAQQCSELKLQVSTMKLQVQELEATKDRQATIKIEKAASTSKEWTRSPDDIKDLNISFTKWQTEKVMSEDDLSTLYKAMDSTLTWVQYWCGTAGSMNQHIKGLNETIEAKDNDLKAKDAAIQARNAAIQAKNEDIKAHEKKHKDDAELQNETDAALDEAFREERQQWLIDISGTYVLPEADHKRFVTHGLLFPGKNFAHFVRDEHVDAWQTEIERLAIVRQEAQTVAGLQTQADEHQLAQRMADEATSQAYVDVCAAVFEQFMTAPARAKVETETFNFPHVSPAVTREPSQAGPVGNDATKYPETFNFPHVSPATADNTSTFPQMFSSRHAPDPNAPEAENSNPFSFIPESNGASLRRSTNNRKKPAHRTRGHRAR